MGPVESCWVCGKTVRRYFLRRDGQGRTLCFNHYPGRRTFFQIKYPPNCDPWNGRPGPLAHEYWAKLLGTGRAKPQIKRQKKRPRDRQVARRSLRP